MRIQTSKLILHWSLSSEELSTALVWGNNINKYWIIRRDPEHSFKHHFKPCTMFPQCTDPHQHWLPVIKSDKITKDHLHGLRCLSSTGRAPESALHHVLLHSRPLDQVHFISRFIYHRGPSGHFGFTFFKHGRTTWTWFTPFIIGICTHKCFHCEKLHCCSNLSHKMCI